MRCNVGVCPEVLTDQHLIAEYRELQMPIGSLRKRNWSVDFKKIPKKFKLGEGHISFWYDKLLYLQRRHVDLIVEMNRRGFLTNVQLKIDDAPSILRNDYLPTEDDLKIIKGRIEERLIQKPDFYRFYRKRIVLEEYLQFFNESELCL